VDANIGENTTFNCQTAWISRRRLPLWFFNYKSKLPDNALKNGLTLTIQNIHQNNSGLYNCFGMKPGINNKLFFVAAARLKVLGKFSIVLFDEFILNKLFHYTSWIIF